MRNKLEGECDNAIYLNAIVRANAPSDSVTVCEDKLRIEVRAKPERGAANLAVVQLVARKFGVNTWQVKIVRGLRKKRKLIKIQK